MTLDATVERISRLSVDFYAGAKSMAQLISESGITRFPLALSIRHICAYITAHPEIVDDWLRWSENKRVSAGWYFIRRASGFEVGFHPDGEVLSISDPNLACAEFVAREVGSIVARHHSAST
jgi:hypothetical protein